MEGRTGESRRRWRKRRRRLKAQSFSSTRHCETSWLPFAEAWKAPKMLTRTSTEPTDFWWLHSTVLAIRKTPRARMGKWHARRTLYDERTCGWRVAGVKVLAVPPTHRSRKSKRFLNDRLDLFVFFLSLISAFLCYPTWKALLSTERKGGSISNLILDLGRGVRHYLFPENRWTTKSCKKMLKKAPGRWP